MKRTLEDIRSNLEHVGCDNATAVEMCDQIERLTERCAAYKGQVEAGAHEIARLTAGRDALRAIVNDACDVLRHYDLPEHAYHYERVLAGKVPLTNEQFAPCPHGNKIGDCQQCFIEAE